MKTILIKCIKPTSNRLALVKLIKDLTISSLTKSKDIVMSLHSNIGNDVELEITNYERYYIFIDKLKFIDGEYEVSPFKFYKRNLFLLSVGVGSKEDYVNFLTHLFISSKDEEVIKKCLSEVDKDSLTKMINFFNKKSES